MAETAYEIIDTAPANHIYTGGLLCSVAAAGDDRKPDYLCGELTWDGEFRALNWYHADGDAWRKTVICRETAYAVGMDAADLTGNGLADLVAVEWPLDERRNDPGGGSVYWFEQPDDPFRDPWTRHALAVGWGKAHDLHIGDISGDGAPDVLVRLKDGRISWLGRDGDPRDLWRETVVAEEQTGDGTALWDVTGSGSLDIVTGAGYYENTAGDGSAWQFHPFEAARTLELDGETRVAAGDCAGDGSVTVVISESEVLQNARLVLLHSDNGGQTWSTRVLIDADRDLGALHSLQLLDVDGDGRLDIFTAEMELYVKDTDIKRRPTWRTLLNRGGLTFEETVVLDANLGAHQGFGGHVTRSDGTDFVAKNWSANSTNACDGVNHIVCVKG